VTFHPEAVVTPNAVTVKHDTTFQTGPNTWQSTAQPTTNWSGAIAAAPGIAGPLLGAPVMPVAAPMYAGARGCY